MESHLKILQMPNVGNGGGLGNHLFTIASTIGIALRNGYTPRFPADWKYRKYFNIPDEWFGSIVHANQNIKEVDFTYTDFILVNEIVTIYGYLQSTKYWKGYERQIRQFLTPVEPIIGEYTAVHIRRGDYVNNPNYVELPMAYYLNAIDNTPEPHRFFSDDLAFIRFHFGQYPEPHDEISDLMTMIESKTKVISNSTFAWWAAYLGYGHVIKPDKYFAGELAKRCDTKDFWPDHWFTLRTSMKYDLKDVTFIIPVTIDHPDRLANLYKVYEFLTLHFDTNILIGEVNTEAVEIATKFKMQDFHRTKVVNMLTEAANTPYVFNWDADVVVPPYQIYKAVKRLRDGCDVVYPYDGTFYMVPRKDIPNNLNTLDSLIGKQFPRSGASTYDQNSYGGAYGYNKESFLQVGGDNENFVNYGPEDQERWRRFNLLLDVERVDGAMYHFNHWRGQNSSFSHRHGATNQRYWERISKMNSAEFIEHIKLFEWLK